MPQPMMQMTRRRTPVYIRLQQEIEKVPAREVLLWGFYNTSREQAMGMQGCGLIKD